jgi:hypothetical protein
MAPGNELHRREAAVANVQIFLSTVSAEFRSYRDALRHDLDRPNVTVKVQEDFIATGTETLDKLDEYIRQCDAVIHLVGDMTGAWAKATAVEAIGQRYPDLIARLPALGPFLEPGAPVLSYTQWEAWLALYHRKVLIIAVPQDGAPRDEGYQLAEVERVAQQAHLARLETVGRYAEIRFASADRLAVEVLRSKLQDILTLAGPSQSTAPGLVFVFGAPLGENNSSSWIMILKHFGPNPAYNCKVEFLDADRKNIEHQWLVRHPNTPFPPPGLVGQSQKLINIPEAGPEGPIGNFLWNPLDPDRQHYTISISCRDGAFVERWEVTRVNAVLRAKITIEHGPQWIEKNPNLERTVFKCEDPEFTSTPLATALPESSPPKVHPGWKPNHRFDFPVAIIDPNRYLQVAVGLNDCGCWNILTKHFGDNPD